MVPTLSKLNKTADRSQAMVRMLRPIFILIVFLSFPLSGAARTLSYHNDSTICIQDVQDIGYLGFFAWTSKQVVDALVGNEFMTEREWRTIEMNPRLALFIKEAADLGYEISKGMCPYAIDTTSTGTYEVDDEVDAVRHFVMSSYLAWKAGPQAARTFMASHEDNMFANDNMMDYYNNNLGFEFGESFRRRHQNDSLVSNPLPAFLSEIRAEIRRKHNLPRGNHQDFLVLTSGPSECARRKYPNF
jgi:hypothetical protein